MTGLPPDPQLRVARPSDRPFLLSSIASLWQLEGIDFESAHVERALDGLLAHPDLGRVFVVVSAERAVGYAIVCFGYSLEWNGRDAFLDEFFLLADVRGRGIGNLALAQIETACAALGIGALHLEVDVHNERGAALYRRRGFEAHDRRLLTKRLTAVSPLQPQARPPVSLSDGMEAGPWRHLGSRTVHRNPWFSVREDTLALPEGGDFTYSVVVHPGYVMVVPLLDDGRVVMERIWRHTLQRTQLECPAGGLDGEAPEVAARRELEEETGYVASDLRRLGRFHGSSGTSDERYEIFLATGIRPDGRIHREPTEHIELALLPLSGLRESVLRGELEDGPTSLAILLASAVA